MPVLAHTMRALSIVMLVAGATITEAGSGEPKVPPGRDPGGPAVAIIGAGLDDRRPEVASRLARDGEGEPIAWDFADADRRPFAARGGDDSLAAIMLGEGRAARLVVARVGAGRQDQIAAALRFAGSTPARVVLIAADPGQGLARAHLAEAARHLAGLLLVVPARRVIFEADAQNASGHRGGLLIVAAEGGPAGADVAVVAAAPASGPAAAATASGTHPDDVAAAQVAALAARLITLEPGLAGAALGARILSLAGPRPAGPPALSGIARIYGQD